MNVLTGVGDGSFRETFHYVPATGYVTSIATADFNQDGKLDIVVTIDSPPTARMQGLSWERRWHISGAAGGAVAVLLHGN